MRTLLSALIFSLMASGPALADQINIEQLGVGITMSNVVAQPSWAMIREEGPIALYSAWIGSAAAVLILEKDAAGRIVRFTLDAPGGGEIAASIYTTLRSTWEPLHDSESNKMVSVVSCKNSDKAVATKTLSIGGLYELVFTPAGASSRGVSLGTRDAPKLSVAMSAYLGEIEQGALSASDPAWNSAYLLQKASAVDARKEAATCEPAKPFKALKEFTLGKAIEEQPNFVQRNGPWYYSGFFVAYDMPFADADADIDISSRLNEVRFQRANVSLSDFTAMAGSAGVEMGSAVSVEEVITSKSSTVTYLWKTAAGSVELSLKVDDVPSRAGALSLRYFLHGRD